MLNAKDLPRPAELLAGEVIDAEWVDGRNQGSCDHRRTRHGRRLPGAVLVAVRASHDGCRGAGPVGIRHARRQARRPRHQSDRPRRQRASGGPAGQGRQREAHRHPRAGARLPRRGRGRSHGGRFRRCPDGGAGLQPLRRRQEADGGRCCAMSTCWCSTSRTSACASTPTSRPWGSPCRPRRRRASPSSSSTGPTRSAATTSRGSCWSRRSPPSSAATRSPSCTA